MGIFAQAIKPKNQHSYVGAPSFRHQNPGYSLLNAHDADTYASVYPSIRAIAYEYMTVRPFTIDANGKPVDSPVKNALYHPNQQDSSVAFAEKIAVSTLVNLKTYLLVWRKEGKEARPGGELTPENIVGFTFLEYPSIERRDNQTFYNMGSQQFTDKEVIVLPGGVDPHNLYAGYSPSEAARRWAQLDDYIADFQSGFFENNAIPAGQFIITAATRTEFNDMVDKLQEKHRGAGNNNNVSYTHKPVDPDSNRPLNAQIEWKPFQQTNREIDFKNIFEQANKRIDLAYGVPQIVKGVDDAATYANAQVADAGFAKRAVKPLLLRNYTQITHELNRITDGLGVSITFKYDIPKVADEVKVTAETKNLEANLISKLTAEGYSLNSVVDAFELSNGYKLLNKSDEPTKIENDKPDVDEGGEVEESPDPEKIDGVTPIDKTRVKNLAKADIEQYEVQLAAVVREYTEKDIDKAIENLDDDPANYIEEESEDFTDAMMPILVTVLTAAGVVQYDEGLGLVAASGASIDKTTTFILSESQQKQYRNYLKKIAQSYRDDTAKSIRSVLDKGISSGWTKNELEGALRGIMQTDEWRIQRLATTEINRSQDMGSVFSMRQINEEIEGTVERSLESTSGNPCEFCEAFIDVWEAVDTVMIEKNQVIHGVDGGVMHYDWDDNEGHDPHANGQCVPVFRIVT